MRRFIILLFSLITLFGVQAKTTYVPFYHTSISVSENGKTNAVESQGCELSVNAFNNCVKFTVLHEIVTKDKVKSIKSAKSNAGWNSFAIAFGQGAGTSEALAGSALLNESERAVSESTKLSIQLFIENNSDEDVFVGNINKGVGYWLIPAKGNLTINLENPEWIQLRVSNAYIYDNNVERASGWKQKVSYITVSSDSHVEKKNVEFEDDEVLIYSNIDYGFDMTGKQYNLLDKITFESIKITQNEYRQIKDKNKGK